MRPLAAAVLTIALTLGAIGLLQTATFGGTSYEELLERVPPAADARIPYGAASNQFGDLYLPRQRGPHATVVLIHGGCWQAALPGVELMALMADALRLHGFAVWSVEYRRLGQSGAGYPGTFRDIADALEALKKFAPHYSLDIDHVVVVGHSAGGQLALWAAARPHLPKSSMLWTSHPLAIHGVVSLAGINDLQSYRAEGGFACGGAATIDGLVGAPARDNPYADTSPAALLPIGVRQVVVSGSRDAIVNPRLGHAYAAKAAAAGDRVQVIEIPDAGHFELIDPASNAWSKVIGAIAELSK